MGALDRLMQKRRICRTNRIDKIRKMLRLATPRGRTTLDKLVVGIEYSVPSLSIDLHVPFVTIKRNERATGMLAA